MTVDRTHVLASGYMDRHATYVALSRHRQSVALHYDRQTFADQGALGRALSRERAKDSTLDYPDLFAERRGLAQVAGSAFEAFRPHASGQEAGRDVRQDELARVQAFARAWQDGARMRIAGHELLAHQRVALDRAAGALDRASPGLAAKVAAALERDPALAAPAARGRPQALLRAAERTSTPDLQQARGIGRETSRDRGLER